MCAEEFKCGSLGGWPVRHCWPLQGYLQGYCDSNFNLTRRMTPARVPFYRLCTTFHARDYLDLFNSIDRATLVTLSHVKFATMRLRAKTRR
jgi:hypothetical protein